MIFSKFFLKNLHILEKVCIFAEKIIGKVFHPLRKRRGFHTLDIIKIENCRGGFGPIYHRGKELVFDTFEEAYKVLNPNEEHSPYVINETVVYEQF